MNTPPSRRRSLLFPAFAALFLLAPVAGIAAEPESVSWRDDYGTALAEARSADRLLWIQFTGPWCPNCRRMERDSFPAAEVIKQSRTNFVPLRLRSDVHEQLAVGFQITGLPATVVVASDRTIVAIHQGYLSPVELVDFLKQARRERPASAKSSLAKQAKEAIDRTESTADSPVLALKGYCPVSLIVDRKIVAGKPAFTLVHEGRTYRFASKEHQERFIGSPERFIPVNEGRCPVSQVERGLTREGDPRFGVVFGGRLYLCGSAADRDLFLKTPIRFAAVDVAEQGFCPHCLRDSGLLVRGDPRHELARDGRRFWFPDPTHREAFLASNP